MNSNLRLFDREPRDILMEIRKKQFKLVYEISLFFNELQTTLYINIHDLLCVVYLVHAVQHERI